MLKSVSWMCATLPLRRQVSSPDRILTSQTYELNGPEALSNADIATALSRIIGRTIEYVDLPDGAFCKGLADAGLPGWQVNALIELQQYYRSAKCGEVTNVLLSLLGRPPIKLDQFLCDHRSAFQPLTRSGDGDKVRILRNCDLAYFESPTS